MQCNQGAGRRGGGVVCAWPVTVATLDLSENPRTLAATTMLVSQSARCYDREKLSNEVWEALLVRGARVGSTNEEGGMSLNQPITMLDRSSSSKSICTAPRKDLWSMRP